MADDANEENVENKQAGNTPEGEAQQSKKKKTLVMAIIAAIVLVGGGFGAYTFLKGDSATTTVTASTESTSSESNESSSGGSEKEAAASSSENGEGSQTGPAGEDQIASAEAKYGETHELKPFNLNLGNPLENRYIRLVIAIEYKGGANQKAEIIAKSPKIRDVVVSITTKKTMEFLLGPDGKDHLRHELFVTINQSLENKIEAVYITDMLIE